MGAREGRRGGGSEGRGEVRAREGRRGGGGEAREERSRGRRREEVGGGSRRRISAYESSKVDISG